jgi:hypothetical protein
MSCARRPAGRWVCNACKRQLHGLCTSVRCRCPYHVNRASARRGQS